MSPECLFVLKSKTAVSVSRGDCIGEDLGDTMALAGINIGGEEEEETSGETEPCGDVITSLCSDCAVGR